MKSLTLTYSLNRHIDQQDGTPRPMQTCWFLYVLFGLNLLLP